ncbi:hypothetical protein N7537_001066 [Penicillium hordei]|uniref:Uncharacterized protein n=1 Tax=Penicillium hordei TaxID=40994 RepID=A0AAD6EES8_9EURO|nr:uncharacterized protein N7537_001066 [Penicillium hordei]KAJ5615952.1 hypothetical protein N7537_001066 [Penicillium hordei]
MTEPSWLTFAHNINPANNTATCYTITALGCYQDSWRGSPIAPPANLKIQAENASPMLLAPGHGSEVTVATGSDGWQALGISRKPYGSLCRLLRRFLDDFVAVSLSFDLSSLETSSLSSHEVQSLEKFLI